MIIYVLLVWLTAQHTIDHIEQVGIVHKAETCQNITPDMVKKYAKGYSASIAKHLNPHILCGIEPSSRDDAKSSEPKEVPQDKGVRCYGPETWLIFPDWCSAMEIRFNPDSTGFGVFRT